MHSDDVKRIDIKEFREFGYLQELNRQFLHPLGLALEVVSEEDGSERLGGIWDYRDDPEGIFFGEDQMDPAKARRVQKAYYSKDVTRSLLVGSPVQPINKVPPT